VNGTDPLGLEGGGLYMIGRNTVQFDSTPGPGSSFTYVACPSCHDDRSGLVGTQSRLMTTAEQQLLTATAMVLTGAVSGGATAAAAGPEAITLAVDVSIGETMTWVGVQVPAAVLQPALVATAQGTTFLVVMAQGNPGGPVKRSKYIGPNKRNTRTRPDSNPKECAYCRKPLTSATDHIKSIKEIDKLVKEGALTPAEGKALADDLANLVRACTNCNSGLKGALELGTRFIPKNPAPVIKRLLEFAKNPNTRWLIGNAALTPLLPIPDPATPLTPPTAPPGAGTRPGLPCSPQKDRACHP
jgi:5-methylcytosine-specific restriction endonuclease McrA